MNEGHSTSELNKTKQQRQRSVMSDNENEIDPIRNEEMFENYLAVKKNCEKKKGKKDPKAKSAKEWTDDETSLLIDMLSANPCLWDIYHTDYSKCDLKEIAYTEIATSLDANITSIKAKINSLRRQLGREIAKEKSSKSGQSTYELYASKWIHYDKLNFLIPVFGASKSRDTLKRMNLQEDESAEKKVTPSKRKTIAEKKLGLLSKCIEAIQPMQSQKQTNLETQKYLPLLFMLMKSQN